MHEWKNRIKVKNNDTIFTHALIRNAPSTDFSRYESIEVIMINERTNANTRPWTTTSKNWMKCCTFINRMVPQVRAQLILAVCDFVVCTARFRLKPSTRTNLMFRGRRFFNALNKNKYKWILLKNVWMWRTTNSKLDKVEHVFGRCSVTKHRNSSTLSISNGVLFHTKSFPATKDFFTILLLYSFRSCSVRPYDGTYECAATNTLQWTTKPYCCSRITYTHICICFWFLSLSLFIFPIPFWCMLRHTVVSYVSM